MTTDQEGTLKNRPDRSRAWIGAAVVVGVITGTALFKFGIPRSNGMPSLQWLIALLPGAIILSQLVYLLSSRRKQYRQALGPMNDQERGLLEDLYFAAGPLTFRYAAPAILVTVLCGTIVSALTNPKVYLPWLFQTAVVTETPSANSLAANSSAANEYWPKGTWLQAFRGASLGFLGSYVYLLLMLTDRARQRDIPTGIAMWAAAMPVLGLLMGGVAALIISVAMGNSDSGSSWSRDAIFFVAGMLPRQFASLVQAGVQRMFQQGAAPTIRSLPLVTLRGVGPDVAARLEEEGIHDVSSLAYASPHQLIRTTTYAPRQIVDWIDEALLIATVPAQWEALEKAGITGALDLAWYQEHQEAIAALAAEIKLEVPLLTSVVNRLAEDAQVHDLRELYWDKKGE